MRLAELFLTQEDRDKQSSAKLAKLKQAIESNQAPEVYNAGGTVQGWSWGDLEKLGYAERGRGRVSGTIVDEWWEYSSDAPGPITLLQRWSRNGQSGTDKVVMQPGDKTQPIEIDYS
jgi:hypothetical protein